MKSVEKINAFKRLWVALMAALALMVSAPMASAGDPVIDAAKAAGTVGERIDGYLGVVDASRADPATLRKVEEINAKRREAYADLAGRTGATVEQVARVTGEKLIGNASANEFVLDETGRWTKK